MAIALVGNLGGATSKSSSASIVFTCSAAAGVGSTVYVAYCGSTTTSAVSSVTDSKGNTYTVLADVAGTTSRIAIAGSVLGTALTTSDTITVSLAAASGIRDVAGVNFTGVTITEDVTEKAAAGTSSTPSTGASAATSTADTLTFAAFAVSNATASGTFTQGSGYTKDQEVTTGTTGTNRSLATEHRINSSTGTQTADGTYGSSMAWDALEVVLQAVGGTTYTKTGGAASALVGSGADAVTYVESATATSAVAGSGVDVAVHAETGSATIPVGGSGASVYIPYVPPLPADSGGGGDAWAYTPGDVWAYTAMRPYVHRPSPPEPRAEPARAPTRRERRRFRIQARVAPHVYVPLAVPAFPPLAVPDWGTLANDEAPDDALAARREEEEMAVVYAVLLLTES